jgi:hypothetical protein
MISNPIDAIGDATTRSKLAEVLVELMKDVYPDSDKKGWESWAIKYKSLPVAKKCALSMYNKMVLNA